MKIYQHNYLPKLKLAFQIRYKNYQRISKILFFVKISSSNYFYYVLYLNKILEQFSLFNTQMYGIIRDMESKQVNRVRKYIFLIYLKMKKELYYYIWCRQVIRYYFQIFGYKIYLKKIKRISINLLHIWKRYSYKLDCLTIKKPRRFKMRKNFYINMKRLTKIIREIIVKLKPRKINFTRVRDKILYLLRKKPQGVSKALFDLWVITVESPMIATKQDKYNSRSYNRPVNQKKQTQSFNYAKPPIPVPDAAYKKSMTDLIDSLFKNPKKTSSAENNDGWAFLPRIKQSIANRKDQSPSDFLQQLQPQLNKKQPVQNKKMTTVSTQTSVNTPAIGKNVPVKGRSKSTKHQSRHYFTGLKTAVKLLHVRLNLKTRKNKKFIFVNNLKQLVRNPVFFPHNKKKKSVSITASKLNKPKSKTNKVIFNRHRLAVTDKRNSQKITKRSKVIFFAKAKQSRVKIKISNANLMLGMAAIKGVYANLRRQKRVTVRRLAYKYLNQDLKKIVYKLKSNKYNILKKILKKKKF